MSEFLVYLSMGRDHILDYQGYDHILFVVALCALYTVADWKRILILVTAFTIGHSLTLALATLGYLPVNSAWVEFLIPVTIFITAISNLFRSDSGKPTSVNYVYALFFGLIHGMGFSNFLRALLGSNEQIVTPLLAFNLGLEFGQIIIVGIFLTISFLAVNLASVKPVHLKTVLSIGIAAVALYLMSERLPWK